ncbi:CPBP family intramembrane glutamic endopeptidase [Paenibacillus taiwanensis]|uniref:CPBP family intramembrane glutamic endopeptidase n=1 Tax=Paenibacillus taiwanensis TaxID=401638 RepID=UPI0003FD65D0|nr:type II CAAX endopeptidase family protein [Paenibacillus taiwanensis]
MNATPSTSKTMHTTNEITWPRTDPWSYKELVTILVLIFGLVPWLIESRLHNWLTEIFNNTFYSGISTGLVMGVVFTFSVYLITLLPNRLGWCEIGIRSFPLQYSMHIAFWSVIVLVVSVLILFVMSLFGGSYENSKTESIQSHLSVYTLLLGILSAGILSPIYEELLYRGFLYRWCRTRFGRGWALFLSSFIFMIAHIPTYNTLALNLAAGLIFAWTYEKTQSVIPGIIVHGVTNTIFVLLTFIA